MSNSLSEPTASPLTQRTLLPHSIVTTWRKTWTLRQCPPFLTYPIFSAGIICVRHSFGPKHQTHKLTPLIAQVYNASFDESLAHPAKVHLLQCMEALKEMEVRLRLRP